MLIFSDSECQCDIRGIAANNGCNTDDGSCTCKRNVVNRDCDQCAEEHYGLSESDPLGNLDYIWNSLSAFPFKVPSF